MIRVAPSGPVLTYPTTDVGEVLRVQANGEVEPSPQLEGIAVANLAALRALERATVGQIVHVQTLGRAFIAVRADTSALQSCVVEASTGSPTVQWQTVVSTSEQRWQEQTSWYVDAINGDDEHPGTVQAAPIKTTEEIQRRWGVSPRIVVDVTVTLLTDIDHVFLSCEAASGSLTIRGTPVAIVTSTLASFAAFSHGVYGVSPPTPTVIEITGVADATPYLGLRVRSGVKLAWIDIANPTGAGLLTMSTCPWGTMSQDAAQSYSQTNPVVGDAAIIETLTAVQDINLNWTGASGGSGSHPWILVRDVDLVSSLNVSNVNRDANVRLFGCNLRQTAFVLNAFEQRIPQVSVMLCCGIRANMASFSSSVSGCLLTNAFATLMGVPGIQNYVACLSRTTAGSNQNCWNVEVSPTAANLTNCQGFSDSAGPAGSVIFFQTLSTSTVVRITNCSGVAAAGRPGVVLRDFVELQFVSTQSYNILGGAGAAELAFSASPALGAGGFKWSDCLNGFVPGEWYGEGILSAGILPVVLAPALTDFFVAGSKVMVGYRAPAIAAPALGFDAVTTAGFNVGNGNAADNTSVCWWSVSSKVVRRCRVLPATLV